MARFMPSSDAYSAQLQLTTWHECAGYGGPDYGAIPLAAIAALVPVGIEGGKLLEEKIVTQKERDRAATHRAEKKRLEALDSQMAIASQAASAAQTAAMVNTAMMLTAALTVVGGVAFLSRKGTARGNPVGFASPVDLGLIAVGGFALANGRARPNKKKKRGAGGIIGAGVGGAAGGAGLGALIGTFVFPGVGTALGAAIGAGVGGVGGAGGVGLERAIKTKKERRKEKRLKKKRKEAKAAEKAAAAAAAEAIARAEAEAASQKQTALILAGGIVVLGLGGVLITRMRQ